MGMSYEQETSGDTVGYLGRLTIFLQLQTGTIPNKQ